jgi:hypothetical protein
MSDDVRTQRAAQLEASREQRKQRTLDAQQPTGNDKGVFGNKSPLITCGYKFGEGAFMGI